MNLSNQRWFLTPGRRIPHSIVEFEPVFDGVRGNGRGVGGTTSAGGQQQSVFLADPAGRRVLGDGQRRDGLSLAVTGASKADGAAVDLEADTGSDGQRWSADGLTDGSIRLLPKAGAKALEIANASTQAGALAQQGRWTHVLNYNGRWNSSPAGPPPTLGGGSNGAGGVGAGGTAGGAGGARGNRGSGGAPGGGGAGGATGDGSGGAMGAAGTNGGGAGGSSSGTGGRAAGGTGGGSGIAGNGGGAGGSSGAGNASGGCRLRHCQRRRTSGIGPRIGQFLGSDRVLPAAPTRQADP